MARKNTKESVEEKVEEQDDDVKKPEPAAPAQPTAASEEEFTPEDESRYAFPMAPIVRLIKQEMDEDKMIRRRVKEGMNEWLESLCRKVAKKMNQSEYTMVEIDDFKTAIEAYEMVDHVEQERQRIVATLEKIKQDCDSLIMDVNRKFISPE
ncbi:MAG: histone-like protein [Candidatus Altiarchaeota archaeon]